MPMCEKCWVDAYGCGYGDQPTRYLELLKERAANPCTPREQAGQWWDEKRGCDSRSMAEGAE
jgi:hypothetical protein